MKMHRPKLDGVKATAVTKRLILAFLAHEDKWLSSKTLIGLTDHGARLTVPLERMEKAGWIQMDRTSSFFVPTYRMIRPDRARRLLELATK